MLKILTDAAESILSGIIPIWLWLLIVIQAGGFLCLYYVDIYGLIDANLPIAIFVAIACVILLVWSCWEISRRLMHSSPLVAGSFSRWIMWLLLFDGLNQFAWYAPFYIFDDTVAVWLSPIIMAISGAVFLPLLVHSLSFAANRNHSPQMPTIFSLQMPINNLRLGYIIWAILWHLVDPVTAEWLNRSSDPVDQMTMATVSTVSNFIFFIGEFAIAAVGYNQLRQSTSHI